MTFYASVDGPEAVISGRYFREPVALVGQPVYGRVLFTRHEAVVEHCTFELYEGERRPALSIDGVYGAEIRFNTLTARRWSRATLASDH